MHAVFPPKRLSQVFYIARALCVLEIEKILLKEKAGAAKPRLFDF
jgi:hypothetical protein